jgi:hypothetical protein
MEVRMARRTDRPLLRVRVSFEATRLGAQHLIDAYARLVPPVRRARWRPQRNQAGGLKIKVASTNGRS